MVGPLHIVVVGGSIGGLTAACLLRDSGHDVHIYERSAVELQQRGAGIGFLPATYRYLKDRAGLDLASVCVQTDFIRYLNRQGDVTYELSHSYLFSSWNTVYSNMLRQLEPEKYVLGHELVDFKNTDSGAQARFTNGVTVDADLLIGADGIGSVMRTQLQPRATGQYAGYVAWRGMAPESVMPAEFVERLGDSITYFVYQDSHILVYPIPSSDSDVSAGNRMINFVWYRNYAEGDELNDVLTDRSGNQRDISVPPGHVAVKHVEELRSTAQRVLPEILSSVIQHTPEPFIQVIYDIEVEKMVFGRICLLGDAAFAVRPHAAAGTAKASDDGWALDTAIRESKNLDEALRSWEARQLTVGSRLLARTRRIGSRSQFENNWDPTDPELIFGLHKPGD